MPCRSNGSADDFYRQCRVPLPLIMTTTPECSWDRRHCEHVAERVGIQPQYGALFAVDRDDAYSRVLLLLFQRYFIQSIASKGLEGVSPSCF